MNLNKLAMGIFGATMVLQGTGCHPWGTHTRTTCYHGGVATYCDTDYYYDDGSVEHSRDMITDLAQLEREKLEANARHYASKFSLSDEQGLKLAKTINDFNAIQNRSEADMADFAKRLYGVDPSEIVSAVGQAQAGNNSRLESLVAEAARNFNTTPDNMKNVVKTLHGKMLEQQGVRF